MCSSLFANKLEHFAAQTETETESESETERTEMHNLQGYKVPWKEIFKSLPVWAVIMAHFTENWGFYTFLTELPTFLNDVLHYNMYKWVGSVTVS